MTAEMPNVGSMDNLLTEEELMVLRADTVRDTAHAISSFALVAQELGVANIEDATGTLRSSLEEMSPTDLRKTRKAMQKMARLVGANLRTEHPTFRVFTGEQEEAPEAAALAVEEEVATAPVVELAPEPPVVEADEPVVEPTHNEEAQPTAERPFTIDRLQAEKFYTSINKLAGEEVLPFEPYDPDEVIGLVTLFGLMHRRKDGWEYAGRLAQILEGESYVAVASTIPEEKAVTPSALSQLFTSGAPKIVADRIKKGQFVAEAPKKRGRAATVPYQAAQKSEMLVQPLSAAAAEHEAAVPSERPLEEEPRHVQIAYRFASQFGLNSAERTVLTALLDNDKPTDHVGPNTRSAQEKIVQSICETFGDLTNKRLALSRGELYRARKLLGLSFDVDREVPIIKDPESLYQLCMAVRKNGGDARQEPTILYSGLEKLLQAYVK